MNSSRAGRKIDGLFLFMLGFWRVHISDNSVCLLSKSCLFGNRKVPLLQSVCRFKQRRGDRLAVFTFCSTLGEFISLTTLYLLLGKSFLSKEDLSVP